MRRRLALLIAALLLGNASFTAAQSPSASHRLRPSDPAGHTARPAAPAKPPPAVLVEISGLTSKPVITGWKNAPPIIPAFDPGGAANDPEAEDAAHDLERLAPGFAARLLKTIASSWASRANPNDRERTASTGGPRRPTISLRTAWADPSSANGVVTAGMRSMPLPGISPRPLQLEPNYGPPGTTIRLFGESLPATGSIDLQLGDHRLAFERPSVTPKTLGPRATFDPAPAARLRHDAALGALALRQGSNAATDDIDLHFAVTSRAVVAAPGGYTPVRGSATVTGTLGRDGDFHVIAFAAERGSRLRFDGYAFDPGRGRLIDPARDRSAARLRTTLRCEDGGSARHVSLNDGPGDNPSIDTILDTTGTWHLTVSTRRGSPSGAWLGNLVLEAPERSGGLPTVLEVNPQIGRPGARFTVSGRFPGRRPEVFLSGVRCPTRRVRAGLLEARVPWGAPPGPIQVCTTHGSSIATYDDVRTHFAVLANELELQTPGLVVDGSSAITGRLVPGGIAQVDIDLGRGRRVNVAAYSCDDACQRIHRDLDREGSNLAIMISGPGLPVQTPLEDDNGGPGAHPALGAKGFEATRAGRYTITVRDQGWRGGAYILLITEPDAPGGSLRLLELPIAITVFVDPVTGLPATTPERLRAQVDQLGLWAQAGISPNVVLQRREVAVSDLFELDDLREMMEVMRDYSVPGAQNVFVVGGLPIGSGGGCTTLGVTWLSSGHIFLDGRELPDPDSDELPVTLAHELGHALGRLRDLGPAQRDNLMHGNLATQTAAGLCLDQVNQVRFSWQDLEHPRSLLLPAPFLVHPLPLDRSPPQRP